MLEESGLVRLEKNRGVFVREISRSRKRTRSIELRAVMDEFVGRRLAARVTPEQMKALRGIVERMDAAARNDDPDAYHLLNLQFHDTLVEYAGNRKLAGRVSQAGERAGAVPPPQSAPRRAALPHSAASIGRSSRRSPRAMPSRRPRDVRPRDRSQQASACSHGEAARARTARAARAGRKAEHARSK